MHYGELTQNMETVHTIGWQGITVTVPAHWHLAHARGTVRNGYFRVDDEEHPRIEVRWSHPKRNLDLSVRARRYLTLLRRRARRDGKKIQFSESPRPFTSSSVPKNKEVLCFSWSTDVHAWGTIWKCRDCGRVVAAQVLFHGRDKHFSLVTQVFSSLEDHPQSEEVLWCAHGLSFSLPDQFKVKEWVAKLDSSRAEFQAKRRNRLIIACRDAAQSGSDPATLVRFAKRTLKRRGKRLFETFRTERVLSHDGIAFAEAEPIRRLRRRRGPVRKRPYGVAFYCPERGKQFAIMANDRHREFVGKALTHFACH